MIPDVMKKVIMLSLLLFAEVAGAGDGLTDLKIRKELPGALMRGVGRLTPKTSQIEWTVSWGEGRDDGLIERHITRTAGDSVWESNLGDENGYHQRSLRTFPPQGDVTPEVLEKYLFPRKLGAGTRNSLISGGYVWHLNSAERPLSGEVERREQAGTIRPNTDLLPLDFSAIGLAPGAEVSHNLFGVQTLDLDGFEEAEFNGYRAGSLDVVVAEFNDRRFEWYLDPQQEGLPVMAALYRGGELIRRSDTRYTEIDGRLFPTSVEFYEGDTTRPSRAIDIERATFDKPWHMQSIGPNDIGVLFGTQLWSTDGKDGPLRWDGTELLSSSEYLDLEELFGVRPDPRIVELMAKVGHMTVEEYLAWIDRTMVWRRAAYFEEHGERPWLDAPLGRVPGEKDEWDVYVEKFIKEHKLVPAAVKRAKDILDRSKKLRDRHERKNAAAIREAERDGDKEKLAHYKGMTKRIFDEVLVRSLKSLIPKSEQKKSSETLAKKAEK
ncbi:MAG: hypothetical protein ACE5D3_06590 [Candidatus Binatia bacterium]